MLHWIAGRHPGEAMLLVGELNEHNNAIHVWIETHGGCVALQRTDNLWRSGGSGRPEPGEAAPAREVTRVND